MRAEVRETGEQAVLPQDVALDITCMERVPEEGALNELRRPSGVRVEVRQLRVGPARIRRIHLHENITAESLGVAGAELVVVLK